MKNIAIIGSGTWGVALSIHLANMGHNVKVWSFAQEEADSIFNTSLIYELGVLKDDVMPLLEKITPDEKEYAEAKRLTEFLKYFEQIDIEDIPKNSLLREFIGGGIFDYD